MKPTYEELAQQLANAESKCRVLAAENAGLKKFCKDAAFDADYEAELGMERGGFTDALNDIQTPATDAFLAEVRAQAQSEVIEWLDAEITAIDTMYRGDPTYEHDAYWMKTEVLGVIESARKAFAAMLQGEPQNAQQNIPKNIPAGNSPVIDIDLASGPDRTVEVRYFSLPGYSVVPIEPTQEMTVAGGDAYVRSEEVNQYPTDAARRIWAAMLQEATKCTK